MHAGGSEAVRENQHKMTTYSDFPLNRITKSADESGRAWIMGGNVALKIWISVKASVDGPMAQIIHFIVSSLLVL